ncbi:MAG: hypothetical protein HYS13_22510 [Planctomycetia bacterium]|nr:hypothetical protein [Planctomycetia bacterium]
MLVRCFLGALTMLALAHSSPAHEVANAKNATNKAPANGQPISAETPIWHTDYAQAYLKAKAEEKFLLIFFDDPQQTDYEKRLLSQLPQSSQHLTPGRYVLAHLPLDAKVTTNGQESVLVQHESFAELRGGQGVAIVDLMHTKAKFYTYVVSCFPFEQGKTYDSATMDIVLTLPPGTITQRTMVFAVRMQPEGAQSTHGQIDETLAGEAESHSDYQANIGVQGHHNWDVRFHRINARLGADLAAQEVCAESWPNESLVEACIDCVHSWRQSSGHWDAVRSYHPRYGYDIKRGRNGIWYATGIFGRRW